MYQALATDSLPPHLNTSSTASAPHTSIFNPIPPVSRRQAAGGGGAATPSSSRNSSEGRRSPRVHGGSPSYQLRNFNANARLTSLTQQQPNYYGYSTGGGKGGGSSGSEGDEAEEMGGGSNYRTNPSTTDGWRSGRQQQPQTTVNYHPSTGIRSHSQPSTTAIGYTPPYPDPPPMEDPLDNSYGIGMRSSAYASSYIPSTSSTHHLINNNTTGLSQRSSAVSGSTNPEASGTTQAQFSSFV